MGTHFPAADLDNAIRFSTLSRMSGFLWHSSKWASRFGHFLQYTSGLEVLVCSLDTDLNYVTAMLQLCFSLNHYLKLQQRCGNFLGVFSKIDTQPQQHSLLDLRPSPEFPAKCVNSLDEILKIPWWLSFDFGLFVLSIYILDSYVTCLTLSFNTICVLPFILIFNASIILNSPYFDHIQVYFKPI